MKTKQEEVNQNEIYKKFRKPPRKNITKKMRESIAVKTNNKCGYCGIDLPKRWHVDHIIPYVKDGAKCELDNFMASCPQCNRFKSTFSIEGFRKELAFQIKRAREYSVNFRFAEKFNQLKVLDSPIVFYFERIGLNIKTEN